MTLTWESNIWNGIGFLKITSTVRDWSFWKNEIDLTQIVTWKAEITLTRLVLPRCSLSPCTLRHIGTYQKSSTGSTNQIVFLKYRVSRAHQNGGASLPSRGTWNTHSHYHLHSLLFTISPHANKFYSFKSLCLRQIQMTLSSRSTVGILNSVFSTSHQHPPFHLRGFGPRFSSPVNKES